MKGPRQLTYALCGKICTAIHEHHIFLPVIAKNFAYLKVFCKYLFD